MKKVAQLLRLSREYRQPFRVKYSPKNQALSSLGTPTIFEAMLPSAKSLYKAPIS